MKLSDYVIDYIVNLGVHDVFMISGGGCIHLIDSVGRNKNLRYICNHHEQASAMAVEGYAKLKNDIGVAIVTTGPGGTNAITGVGGCWLDSTPALIISGQVRTAHTIAEVDPALRQFGDQELNIIDIVRSITKYAVMIDDADSIKYHLDKAVYLAQTGRPGPVWIDIPLDIQAADIDRDKLIGFTPPEKDKNNKLDEAIEKTISMLKASERPILMAGHGIRLARGEDILRDLLRKLEIPAVTSIDGGDLITDDYTYYAGRPGITGQRGANFALQNSDLFIAIGARMKLRQIGYEYKYFARGAKKIIVDIDEHELQKKSINPDLAIHADAREFLEKLRDATRNLTFECSEWKRRCLHWKEKYNDIEKAHREEKEHANSYYFIHRLSQYLTRDDHVVTSDGTANISTLYFLKLKKGQRMFTNSGMAAMGYGLPAAIGACIANGRRQIICMENDGSLQMNIQELQTIVHHDLPIKIFVFNNFGYGSIRQTQYTFCNGNIVAADPTSGVSFPDLRKIADAYGIPYEKISCKADIDTKLSEICEKEGKIICEIMMNKDQQFLPKVTSKLTKEGKFISVPLEDMYPFLPRNEFRENMIIPPIEEE